MYVLTFFEVRSSKFEVESHSMLDPFRSSVVRSWVVRSWVLFEVESFSKLSPFQSWVLFEVKSFEVGSFEVQSFEVQSVNQKNSWRHGEDCRGKPDENGEQGGRGWQAEVQERHRELRRRWRPQRRRQENEMQSRKPSFWPGRGQASNCGGWWRGSPGGHGKPRGVGIGGWIDMYICTLSTDSQVSYS